MPRPTEPVKRVCYSDDITVWASGVQIPVLEQRINSYLEEMSTFLKDNSLLISAPKSTVTLSTSDPFQARFHPKTAIDHLHCEAQMLKVTEHSDLLSAQYLVKCLNHENICHITTLDQPPRMMKHTTIAPLLADTTKESLKAVHTAAVSKSRRKQTVNRVLRDRPPDISETETSLRRPQRTTLSQLRSGHGHLLNSYKHRIDREDDPQCKDCGYDNQDVNHIFDCPAHPTVMSPTTKLWSMPADTIGEFAYLDPERLD